MSRLPVSVALTGLGCVSPLGIGLRDTVAALRQSRDCISEVRLFSVEGCRSRRAGQVPKELSDTAAAIAPKGRRWARPSQMLLCALAEALEANPEFVPDCVVIGTTSGGMTLGEEFHRSLLSHKRIATTARRLRHYVPNQPVLQAMEIFGFEAPVRIISNACASGTNALGVGMNLVRHGLARRVLAGGYDALAQLVFAGFDCLQAATPDRCRPFDCNRNGLSLGEGAALFCLEAGEAEISLAGYGSAFDAHHLTQPHPSGRGPREAMLRALADASLAPTQIDYINAHGTGTPLNDASEGQAMVDVCPNAPVSSTKGMTGHALGAAGAIEAAYCALALSEGFLPANINFQKADLPLDVVANQIRPTRPSIALSNSFGFGGSNASIILTRS